MTQETLFESIVALVNAAKLAAAAGRMGEASEKQGRAIELAQEPKLRAVLYTQLGQFFAQDNEPQKAVAAHELGFKAMTTEVDLTAEFEQMFARHTGKTYVYVPLNETVSVILDLHTPEMSDELNTAANDPLLAVYLLVNIGNAYLQMGQYRTARSRYEMALARPEIDALQRAIVHTNIGQIDLRLGETDAAEASLRQAVDLFERIGETPVEQRRATVALAGLRHQQGAFVVAQALYEQARSLYQRANDVAGLQKILVTLGHIARQQGEWDSAEIHFQDALALNPTSRQLQGLLHWGLGLCHQQRGDLTQAIASLNESLRHVAAIQSALRTDEGKVAYLDSVQEIYDTLIRVQIAATAQDETQVGALLAVLDRVRGRAFHDLMRSRRRAHGQRIEAQKMAASVSVDDEFAFSVAQIAPSESVQPPSFMPPGGVLEPEAKRRPPPENRPLARLSFWVLPEQVIVVAVSAAGTIHSHSIAIAEAALTERLTDLRAGLNVDSPNGIEIVRGVRVRSTQRQSAFRDQLRSLYTLLIAPLEAHLPDDGTTPLVIEPHAALWLLPFAALLDENDRYFSERSPFLLALSHQSLIDIRNEPDYGAAQSLRALIVGNPVMPTVGLRESLQLTLKPLIGAEEEARNVAEQIADVTLLIGADATESAVRAHLPNHQIVHLATHGIAYADDPNASFVALGADDKYEGVLTVRDVLNGVVSADLVTLSACQTGLGRLSGDGMIGLGRAFLAVGARSVLVSQWSVSDQATALFMRHFYQHYLAEDDKAIALYKTMNILRQHEIFHHPRYWSAFMLIGVDR